MNKHALGVLELNEVLRHLECWMPSVLGLERLKRLRPSSSKRVVSLRLQRTKEALALLGGDGDVPLGQLKDPRFLLVRAAADARLLGEEIVIIAEFLTEVRRVRAFLRQDEAICPTLGAMIERCVSEEAQWEELLRLETDSWHAVDIHGKVRDDASEKLSRIRARVRKIEEEIRDVAHRAATNPAYRDDLQEPVVHYRGGKPVLPVKAGFRVKFKGVVRDVSASGATLFIEPIDAAKLGRRSERLRKEEAKEELRILSWLSRRTGNLEIEFNRLRGALARLEIAFAAARFADARGGVCALVNTDGIISLKDMRHPLLEEDSVPLTLTMDSVNRTVLITGPNTGGKTVALKTMGLSVLMTACGLPILGAEGTNVPIVKDVLADIGDEQSIEQSLSTFSGHMANIVSIMKSVQELDKGHCLVLLDELGAGTDPAEGEALGCSIMEWLHSKGARNLRLLATSHFAGLKELAASTEGMINSRMEFDSVTLRPTYQLTMGASGSSQAFPVAAKLGLDSRVLDRAGEYLGPERVGLQKLIDSIERERGELKATKSALMREREELIAGREKARLRQTQLEDQSATEREEFRRKAEEILVWSRQELKKARAGDREAAVQRRHVQLHKVLSEFGGEPEPESPKSTGFSFSPGANVLVRGIGAGELIEVDGKDSTGKVAVKGVHVVVPLHKLEPIPADRASQDQFDISRTYPDEVEIELKIVGMRAAEAKESVERYLDQAVLAELSEVRIVHGLGQGVLKEIVRTTVLSHPGVAKFRHGASEEGGYGVTVITLD